MFNLCSAKLEIPSQGHNPLQNNVIIKRKTSKLLIFQTVFIITKEG